VLNLHRLYLPSHLINKNMDNNYAFLRSQVKAFHPNWSEEQINAEIEKIMNGEEEDDGCLYCGS